MSTAPARATVTGADVLADVRAVLPGWLAARVLLLVGWIAARVVATELLGGPTEQQGFGLFLWDGAWYRELALRGFEATGPDSLRFFPLYPWLGRSLGWVLLGRPGAALLVVATVCSLLAAALLRRWVLVEGFGAPVADRAALLLSLWPAAFVLAAAYAEALMLVAAIGCFVALRTGRWWWAAGLATVAAASRPLGVLLAAAALVEVVRERRRPGLAGVAAVAGAPVGLALVLLHARLVDGRWLAPFTVQEPLRGGFHEPVTRLAQAVVDLFRGSTADALHAPFGVALVVLVAVSARRLPASATVFSAGVVAVALAAENLNSLERYGLNAFPLVVALALASDRWPAVRDLVPVLSGAAFTALVTLAWLGPYVP